MVHATTNFLIIEKSEVYNQYLIPAITYQNETRKLTKRTENILRIAQKDTERAMQGENLRDRNRLTWIKAGARVKDSVHVVKQ